MRFGKALGKLERVSYSGAIGILFAWITWMP